MGELNITFSGICVSLHSGIVPGVSMRTILPDASALRFGMIRIPGEDNALHDVEYYLMPHLAIVKDLIFGGRQRLLTGQYFRVINAKDQPFCREGGGFSLDEFKPDVQLEPDIVYEGNALAYFDIYGGRVWTEGNGNEPRVTCVAIKTHGTPKIAISPLPRNLLPWGGETTVETNELFFSNLDIEAAAEDFQFDFLLNFLVAKGGIPHQLSKRTPGMTGEPRPLTLDRVGERMKAFGTLIETAGTFAGWQAAVGRGDEPEPRHPLPISKPPETESFLGKIAKGGIDPIPFDSSCSTSNFP